MDTKLISTLEFGIRGFDCGYGGPLRPFAMANFLQEAAGENATRLGFGMGDLHAKGWTWMLSRLELRTDLLPRDGERVSVRTWPAGTRKLFALRDIEMLGQGGRSLVRAVYAYLVVDMAARRPLRPESVFGSEIPPVGAPHPVPDFAFDIPVAEGLEKAFAQRVSGRHIDHNGHANNAHLIDWLVDAAMAPSGGGPGRPELASLRVEFLSEALEGDELLAARAELTPPSAGAREPSRLFVTELSRGASKVARAQVGLR
jgi:acyl-ACP thioesterase